MKIKIPLNIYFIPPMIDDQKINILFVDDDKATNFLNKHLAKGIDSINTTYLLHSGFETINFLKECLIDTSKTPSVIFLDINMPAMTGWDFLEEFYKFDENFTANIEVIMLSSSDDPCDLARFKNNPKLSGFLKKPLNKQVLNSVLI